MRLDIGIGEAEQLLRAVDRQRLDRVRRAAALVIALARIAFGIFVGEYRPLRFDHRAADDVLAGDQLDLLLLAQQLARHRIGDGAIGGGEAVAEEAVGLHRRVDPGGCGAHVKASCKLNLSTRAA